MGKIALFLPANGFHGNVQNWDKLYESRLGLDAIGQSKVRVNFSCQEIDLYLFPWLEETVKKYPSIEWLNSTHDHVILPSCFIHSEIKKHQTALKMGNSKVCFFSEFSTPAPEFINAEAFLVLAANTHWYSHYDVSANTYSQCHADKDFSDYDYALPETLPQNLPSIKYGSKTGIIMRNSLFAPVHKAFFRFQKNPFEADNETNGKDPLENLLDQFERIARMPDDVIVIIPIDIEAPWVGSNFGAKIWEMLFDGIKKRAGLADCFINLSDYLDFWKERAQKVGIPQRELTKWQKHNIQTSYLLRLFKNFHPEFHTDEKFMRLYGMAACSDILAAYERKYCLLEQKISFFCKKPDGKDTRIEISYNQEIIDVQRAALLAAENMANGKDNADFASALRVIERFEKRDINSLFVKQTLAYAKNFGL